MLIRRKTIDILSKTQILVLVDNSFNMFTYSPYSTGYHSYKDVRRPIVGDESLICEQKETNAYDRNVVFTSFDDCISKKVVGMFRLIWGQIPPVSKLSYSRRCDWKASETRSWIWQLDTLK